MEDTHKPQEIRPADKYPGVGIDKDDKDKVSEFLTKQDTCSLNNNPRNNDIDE